MGQTERAVERFWRPILVSACNEEPARISCTHAFKIFRDGFLANSQAYHFGVPTVPLGVLYTEPTIAYLKARGGCARLRTIVDKIHFEGGAAGRISGVTLQDGETLSADYYISALQCDLLLKLLPPEVTASVPYWENLNNIDLVPIMGVHLWFDREVRCPPALAVLDRSTEWIFNKTDIFGASGLPGDTKPAPQENGTYLSVVISASRRYAKMGQDEITALVLKDVQECLPDARTAELVRSRVIRWPKATISPRPGVDALRPEPRSPITNLTVAGEWTQTGWPSTMEGAARSGFRAAECILQQEGRPQSLLARGPSAVRTGSPARQGILSAESRRSVTRRRMALHPRFQFGHILKIEQRFAAIFIFAISAAATGFAWFIYVRQSNRFSCITR